VNYADKPEPLTQPMPSSTANARHPSGRRGFTLIELLVVIGIILILAAILTPTVFKGLRRARQAQCAANLHNFGIALFSFRTDTDDDLPDWLSNLHPRYNNDLSTYICPSDRSQGMDGGKPNHLDDVGDQFAEVDDNASNPHPTRNTAVEANSYFYEFSGAACGWYPEVQGWPSDPEGFGLPPGATITWKAVKLYQMMHGDDTQEERGPYPAIAFPIVRCFHHTQEQRFTVRAEEGGAKREGMTQNLAFAGNVFIAPLTWELTPIGD